MSSLTDPNLLQVIDLIPAICGLIASFLAATLPLSLALMLWGKPRTVKVKASDD